MQTMSQRCPSARWALTALVALLGVRTAAAQPAYEVSSALRFPGFPSTQLVEMQGQLFFPASLAGTFGLWKSDGTPAGTVLVKSGLTPDLMTVVDCPGLGQRLFFVDLSPQGTELWISDGTDPGTVVLKDILPGASGSAPSDLTAVSFTGIGNRLVFSANNGANGRELWISDGTAAGTVLVKDLFVGAGSGNPTKFIDVNGTLFFASFCNSGCSADPVVWKSNGTTAGTVLVSNTAVAGEMLNVGSTVFFVSNALPFGNELWTTDGTPGGTQLLLDINNAPDSFPHYLTAVGGTLFFAAFDSVNGEELWQSDGTALGTFAMPEIVPGVNPSYTGPQQLRSVNGRLYFVANDGATGQEIWSGDAGGVGLLKDINPGPASSVGSANNDPTLTLPGLVAWDCFGTGVHAYPDACTVVRHANGLDYFFADDGTSGGELWQTDGTGPGTVRVADTYPGPDDFYVSRTATRIVGDRLFFGARGPDLPSTDYATTMLWALPTLPALLAGDATVIEGNGGPVNASFTVMVYPPPVSPVSVNYATADGTTNPATAGVDYAPASGSLTFGPGASTQTVLVPILGEGTPEANETFFLNLSGASGASVADGQGLGTIVNDDGPGISVSDVPGQIESGLALFFVTLSAPSADTVTVDYSTADGLAVAGSDYTAATGTLTFLPGETFKSVNVPITNDNLDEPDENFFLNLTNPIFAVVVDGQGECTIIDDDPTPNMTINNVSVTEPNTGTNANMSFTVTLSAASGQAVMVDYATADGTTNPATGDVDYVASAGTMTIPPGTLTVARVVTIIGDNLDELNETLNLNLTNPVHANITDGLGVGTINDNDTTNITINNVTAVEGNPPGTTPFNFTVSLSNPFHLPITIDYATANGTTNPALAGVDYIATSGTLTIPSGSSSQVVTVEVIRDNLDEPVAAETFFVNLSNNSGANLTDPQGQGNITDDDQSQIQITSVSLPEGDTGNLAPFVFDLTLSGPSVNQITVNYSTAGAAPNPATINVDFQPSAGTLTFPAGTTSGNSLTVNVIGDASSEPNETFHVNLSGQTGGAALPNPAYGVGTILNDDSPGFAINDVTVTEGNTGSLNATFTVSLLGTFSGNPSVDFATADGTALAGVDYTATSGTLTFTTGVSTRTLSVPVLGDVLDEANENFFVNLANPQGGPVIIDSQGQGTITDNDTTSITVNNVTVAENVAGGLANFVVTFSVPNEQVVTLDYATADGTAIAPSDYTSVAGTLTFPAGTTSMGIAVPIVDDTLDEPAAAETFNVNLSNSSGPNITDGLGLGSITDNDASNLTIDDVSVTETDTGTVDAVFTVSLAGGKTNIVTVNFATAAGTTNPATPNVDYTTSSGTLTFPACGNSPCPPGSLTQSVIVPVIGDVLPESDETFVVNLSGASGAGITDSQGKATIVDNDGLPSLSIGDVSVIEPGTGNTNAVFTVTLAPTSGLAVTVSYATADGTATAPADYTAASGSLSFAPGTSTKTITVVVKSDAIPEAGEDFLVNLTNPVNADFTDDQAVGTIVDPSFATTELVHGSVVQADLAALNATTADQDRYRIQQPPRASWEVLVDGVTGDVTPVLLERLSSSGTVLQTAVPAGGSAVSLRWTNAGTAPVPGDRIRVTGGCGVNCDAQDVYRLQAWDTTYRVARYNNSASQVTILVLQNPTDDPVTGTAWFWNGSNGALNGSQAFSIPPKGIFSLNTSSVGGVGATSGSITVTNDAQYGALIGKAVSVESATGFTFDSALQARTR